MSAGVCGAGTCGPVHIVPGGWVPLVPITTALSCAGVPGEASCDPAVVQTDDSLLVGQSTFRVPSGSRGGTFAPYSGANVRRRPLPLNRRFGSDGGSLT